MSGSITLRLDDKIINRIKCLAADRHVSASTWVVELVTRAIKELDSFEPARERALKFMSRPVPVSSGPLLREQTHKR